MSSTLPQAFIQIMQPLLDSEWAAFLASYDEPKAYGLRRNPCKSTVSLPFTLTPVPWASEGFYADPAQKPGKHPLHEAGAYYIQEPSAMSVAALLNPQPGDLVCDLCAAPGGKSTQSAGRMKGQGLLVSNEIFGNRARILSQNIERMGISNALVLNEPPERMSEAFPLFFDKIIVDAPCSGEGMFRKDEVAIQEWSPENVQLCTRRQQMILTHADQMLKPGGTMVYSTCTFSVEEDEDMISWFLTTCPDYELIDWKETEFGAFAAQTKNYGGLTDGSIPGTLRLWPHRLRGEGHFAALLHKKGSAPCQTEPAPSKKKKAKSTAHKSNPAAGYEDFVAQYLQSDVAWEGRYELFGEELYRIPSLAPSLKGLKVMRAGLHLGTNKKNRFEPAYALAKALSIAQVKQVHACSEDEAIRYLKGETLSDSTGQKGWVLVCYADCPLGWAKAAGGILKNHYPKGLRWN